MSHVALFTLLETRTLPGWPDVAGPSIVDSSVVLLGIPAAIAVVAALAILGPHWFHQSQGQDLERR